jgi:methyltransferase-like protein
LAENLVQCFAQRAIHFYTVAPPLASRAGERPRAFQVARHQAATQPRVTSLLHELVQLTDFDRQVLRMCDGERSRGEIVAQMANDVRSGKLKASQPMNDPSQLQTALEKALNDGLARLVRVALLEA